MIDVRPMRAEDVDAVAAVHVAGWRTAYHGIVADQVLDGLDATVFARRHLEGLAEERWRTLVAVDERAVGHVSFGPYREHGSDAIDPAVGEILAIYVRPDLYGRGYGAALMSAALDALPQPEVRLWVLAENERARAFYEKFGLRPDGTREMWSPRGTDFRYPELRYSILRADRHGDQ